MSENRKLTSFNVAVMYVGSIMGAGFASGREIWQFFGVFGKFGILGAVIFAVLFMTIGLMISYNARKLNTNNMGMIIVPGGNKKLEELVGYFMAFMLALVMMIMTAAGGALIHQQFGAPYWIGGAIIAVLVVATVLGDFARISKVFRHIMPTLCVAMVVTCLMVIVINPAGPTADQIQEPSPAAPNWVISAFLYTAYNIMALVSIVANSSLNAKDQRTAVKGTGMGGIFLGILAILILITVQCDNGFSQATDMPILGYAGKISGAMSVVYTIILFCAIYSAATSTFYGFTTKIKAGPKKKWIIIAVAVFMSMLGQVGFKNIIKYISPVAGYIGIVVIMLLVMNFFSIRNKVKEGLLDEDKSLS